jgi:hypothetical protein
MVDRGTIGFQLDLFAVPEQVVDAPGGAVVHPVRRRMAGQPPRRKRRSGGAGADARQLELPLESYVRVGLDDDETYRRQHYGYGRDD